MPEVSYQVGPGSPYLPGRISMFPYFHLYLLRSPSFDVCWWHVSSTKRVKDVQLLFLLENHASHAPLAHADRPTNLPTRTTDLPDPIWPVSQRAPKLMHMGQIGLFWFVASAMADHTNLGGCHSYFRCCSFIAPPQKWAISYHYLSRICLSIFWWLLA